MELTLISRLNTAIRETGNGRIFEGLLEYEGLTSDYTDLIENNRLSIRLFYFLDLIFRGQISFRWLLTGEGEKTSTEVRYNELWDKWDSLYKEHEALKLKMKKPTGKIIKMTFKTNL